MKKTAAITVHKDELQATGAEVKPVRSLDQSMQFAHRDDHYMFIIQQTGSFLWELDFSRLKLTGPSLCFVTPGQVHRYLRHEDSEGWLVFVDAGLITRKHRDIFETCVHTHQSVPVKEDNAAFRLAPVLAELLEHQSLQLQQTVIRPLTEALAGWIASHMAQSANTVSLIGGSKYQTAIRFRQLVSARYKELKQIKAYAALLSLTPLYLNEAVKEVTGFPASYWLNQEIVLEAKRMLYYTPLDVKQIAYELGYEDHAYFSRFFKKNTGLTALEFRSINHHLSNHSH